MLFHAVPILHTFSTILCCESYSSMPCQARHTADKGMLQSDLACAKVVEAENDVCHS